MIVQNVIIPVLAVCVICCVKNNQGFPVEDETRGFLDNDVTAEFFQRMIKQSRPFYSPGLFLPTPADKITAYIRALTARNAGWGDTGSDVMDPDVIALQNEAERVQNEYNIQTEAVRTDSSEETYDVIPEMFGPSEDAAIEDQTEAQEDENEAGTRRAIKDGVKEDGELRMNDAAREMAEGMPKVMTEDMTDDMTDDLTDDMTDDITDDITDDMTDDLTDDMTDDMTDDLTEDMTDDMTDDLTEDMTEDMTADRMKDKRTLASSLLILRACILNLCERFKGSLRSKCIYNCNMM